MQIKVFVNLLLLSYYQILYTLNYVLITSSYELVILLILLEKIWFGNLMAKPKQLILQTTTQNLDSKLEIKRDLPVILIVIL